MRFAKLPLLGLLLYAGPARGYVQATTSSGKAALRWVGKNCIRLRPNLDGKNHVIGGTELDALLAGVAAWERPTRSCSFIRFVVAEPAPLQPLADDTQRREDVTVFWVERDWSDSPARTPETVALTELRYLHRPGKTDDGHIVDARLDVNAEHFQFSMNGAPGTINAVHTLTHELGHVLGLDHPCVDGPVVMELWPHRPSCGEASFAGQTMYPSAWLGDTSPHPPSSDETAAICAIYPLASDPHFCPGEQSGCALTAAPASRAGLLILVGLLGLALLCLRWRSGTDEADARSPWTADRPSLCWRSGTDEADARSPWTADRPSLWSWRSSGISIGSTWGLK
jgi:hypothetical protein